VISTISDHDAVQPIPSAAATSQKNESARQLGMSAAELARQLDVPTKSEMALFFECMQ
jgi:hypothetical protein